MQSLKVILVNGIGAAIASIVCGFSYSHFIINEVTGGWKIFWLLPTVTAAIATILLLLKRKTILYGN